MCEPSAARLPDTKAKFPNIGKYRPAVLECCSAETPTLTRALCSLKGVKGMAHAFQWSLEETVPPAETLAALVVTPRCCSSRRQGQHFWGQTNTAMVSSHVKKRSHAIMSAQKASNSHLIYGSRGHPTQHDAGRHSRSTRVLTRLPPACVRMEAPYRSLTVVLTRALPCRRCPSTGCYCWFDAGFFNRSARR